MERGIVDFHGTVDNSIRFELFIIVWIEYLAPSYSRIVLIEVGYVILILYLY